MNKLGVVGSTVWQQILLLVISTFGAVFLVAGIFQYVEYHAAPESKKSVSSRGLHQLLGFILFRHCHNLDVYPLRVTILGSYSPSFELKQLLSLYNGLVEFIEESPIKQADLDRVCAKRATAFFLLANKEAEDHDVEDAAQIVKALAVHRFCNKEVRIIVEVLEPLTQTSAMWDQTDNRVEVVCPIRCHYEMIARSCLVKGLYIFITNLFTSEIKIKEVNQHPFLAEHFHSIGNEIYPLIFPKACCGMHFEEVVEFIFENYNVVLFALDVNVIDPERQESSRKVFLHPKGH